ncbi:MAG: AsmA-like C-terminal domain-containing protein [Stellaceae bacterium]
MTPAPRRGWHRALRFALGAAAAFVAAMAIAAGFFLWLLLRGPVSLDAVAPLAARALSLGNGIEVSIDHTLLSLGPRGHVEVLARGVHFARAGSGTLTLADLAIELSLRAALHGVIAPTRIVVNRPELRLERSADGRFRFAIGEPAGGSGEQWGQKFMGDLLRPPSGEGTLGYLTQLTVRGASLTVDDEALGVAWHAADASADVTRASDRASGNFQIVMGNSGAGSKLAGDFTYLPAYRQVVVRLGFDGLDPAAWSGAAPALSPLAAIDLPVSGSFIAELDPERLDLRDAIVDFRFGKGRFKSAALAGGALDVAGGVLQAGYDPAAGRINLGLFSLDLAPGTITAKGTIAGAGSKLLSGGLPAALDLDLALGARGIRVDDFPRLWPPAAAAQTRDWVVAHLHDGTVDELSAQLGLSLDLTPGAEKPATLKKLDGTMKFSKLAIEYFRPLDLVRNVAGTARFNPTEIAFTATGGDLGKIRASAATARFYKLDTHDEQAKIDVSAVGPLASALAILDTPPLGYAKEIGLDAARAAGSFSAKLDFAFPLVHDLELKDVDYSAAATLQDVALPDVVFDRDLSEGALALKLDRSAVQVDGAARLAGVPVSFGWRQSLDAKAAVRTHYQVKAALDGVQRDALGLGALDGLLDGTALVDASYDLGRGKRGRAAVTIDLKDAALDVKQIGLKKPAGAPAVAQLTLDLADDKLAAIPEASLKGNGLDVKASARFDADGLSGLAIDHLAGGDNDFSGSLARGPDGGWRVAASGKSLDASGLLDALDRSSAKTEPAPPLDIDLRLDRLVLGPDRVARAVSAKLVSDSEHWRSASIDAALSSDTAARLRYGGGAGERQFVLSTDNFGAMLKDLGIYPNIQGGKFALTGAAEDRDGTRVLVTKAKGSDYRVIEAPTLARLLSLASLSGMGALLSGQGIPFNRLEGNVDFATGKISLKNMRAYGGAIGINASGDIDRIAGQMNVSGTLVPAYTLNSVIGDIPVIGNLLLGGQGQGVFASNFRVYGPTDDPQVSVNVLSTLAPGFLRNLFVFSPSGPSSAP